MRILALERDPPVPPRPDITGLLRDEAARVWTMTKLGLIRDIWFTADDRRAVLMLECSSLVEAREHLATLPLVRTGVIDFTLHELRPYDGYERLFGTVAEPAVHLPEEPPEY